MGKDTCSVFDKKLVSIKCSAKINGAPPKVWLAAALVVSVPVLGVTVTLSV